MIYSTLLYIFIIIIIIHILKMTYLPGSICAEVVVYLLLGHVGVDGGGGGRGPPAYTRQHQQTH